MDPLGDQMPASAVPFPVVVAFATPTLALLALWTARLTEWPLARHIWIVPFLVSLAAAFAGGAMDERGLLVVTILALACYASRAAGHWLVRAAAHVVMLIAVAGLLTHLAPGFETPLVVSDVVLGPSIGAAIAAHAGLNLVHFLFFSYPALAR